MKFYLYPFTNIPHKIKWGYDKFFFNRWIKESILALTHHELRDDNPEDADFFIVSFTLMFLSFVSFNPRLSGLLNPFAASLIFGAEDNKSDKTQ